MIGLAFLFVAVLASGAFALLFSRAAGQLAELGSGHQAKVCDVVAVVFLVIGAGVAVIHCGCGA